MKCGNTKNYFREQMRTKIKVFFCNLNLFSASQLLLFLIMSKLLWQKNEENGKVKLYKLPDWFDKLSKLFFNEILLSIFFPPM